MQPETQRDLDFYDYFEYTQLDQGKIATCLHRIDDARNTLIAAQNSLVRLVARLNPYSKSRYHVFYAGGGVTEADWAAFVEKDTGYTEPDPTARVSNLRLVPPRE